jgi:hypothetical protein
MNEIVKTAHKRYQLANDYEATQKKIRTEDLKFVRLGEQWPEAVKRDRERPGAERPMLTINRLLQFRNQIVNEIRQNCPSIKARPGDDKADIKTADIYNGLLRSIQEASNAQVAYETAAECQIDTGLGYFRIITDYCDSESFDQEIKFQRIVDVNSVTVDPSATEPDGSDIQWAFVEEEMLIDDFKRLYPKADVKGWESDKSGWINKDTVRIADYLYLESKEKKLCLMQDGSVLYKDEIPEEYLPLIVRERDSEVKTCKIAKIGGDQILEESELPCPFVPIFPVIGSETFVDGKRILSGLTRPAMDSQRLYNYMESANVELVGLAPKAPYIVAAGQLDGHTNQWEVANRVNFPYLVYNPVSDLGTLLPKPSREPPPPQNMAYEAAMNRASEDIKSTMGIYDASLGNREGDQSGRAINSQMKQASVGNYHFSANLARTIKHAGRVIIALIPKIYDTARAIRILGEDGTPKIVKIDPNAPQSINEGEETIYNLNIGKYDVISDIGPTFATRRQEAAEAQMQMCQADPTLMQIAGDIIVGNMDWPGADDIAKRKKAMLPPQILAVIQEDEGEKKIDPQVEMQMNQMADQVEHLSQALQEAMKAAEGKEEELEIKRFEAQTKRLELTHQMAMDETDLAHRIAMEQMNAEMAMQANTGEAEDPEDEPEEPKEQEPQAPHPDLMNAIKELKDTHAQTQAIIGAINKPKRIIRGADGRPEGIE